MQMSGTGTSTSPCSRAGGFTLLEMLVVVFIIGIMAAMFTLSVGVAGGTDRELRREAERLETLLALALEDASFQSRELGLRLYPGRYEFSVFDRGDLDAALFQRAAQARVADLEGVGADLDRLRRVHTAENDAGVGLRGPQGHYHLLTRVQADAGSANHGFQRTLFQH